MFFAPMKDMTLVGEIADELFPKIKATSFGEDDTFCATLRALLEPRLPEDFDHTLSAIITEQGDIDDWPIPDFVDASVPSSPERDTIFVVSYKNGSTQKEGAFDDVQNKIIGAFNEKHDGFTLDEKACAWFFAPGAGSIRALLFTNEDKHVTVMFVENMNTRKLHTIQSLMPRLLPWYFRGDNAVPAGSIDRELLRSLCSPFHDKVKDGDSETPGYSVLIERYAEKYDFRGAKIRKYLGNFVQTALSGQKENIERELRSTVNSINDAERRICDLYQEKNDLMTRLFGIKFREQNTADNERLKTYFATNRNVDIIRMRGSVLRIATYALLEWWDETQIGDMIRNKNADLYSSIRGISKDDIALFWNALFVDRTLHMRTCACYDIDLERCSVSAVSDFTDYREKDTRVTNPHIRHYSCIGSYAEQFRRYMASGEYIGVVETAIASTKSVNPADPSFYRMLGDFDSNKEKRFFETDDGKLVSIVEAVELLKKEKNGGDKK